MASTFKFKLMASESRTAVLLQVPLRDGRSDQMIVNPNFVAPLWPKAKAAAVQPTSGFDERKAN